MPPISLISPMGTSNFPVNSLKLRMIAAIIIAPMYTGKFIPVLDSSQETTVPAPIAMAI